MAIDLRGVETFPHFKREAALPSTSLTEIKLPPEAGKITIGSTAGVIHVYQNKDSAGNFADGGTIPTGSDLNYLFIPTGNVLSIKLGRGRTRADSVFIAASSSTPDVSIALEEY